MSRPFKPYLGKNTFGVFNEPQGSGEYTLNKKNSAIFCPGCVSNNNHYNRANLNINLVTKLNLNNVPVIQQNDPYAVPTNLSLSSIPFLDYTIDPSGNLFGNTLCGTNNYQDYLQYNPPY
jgi:hypothetical protein